MIRLLVASLFVLLSWLPGKAVLAQGATFECPAAAAPAPSPASASDAMAACAQVHLIEIPDAVNIVATYTIARTVAATRHWPTRASPMC